MYYIDISYVGITQAFMHMKNIYAYEKHLCI